MNRHFYTRSWIILILLSTLTVLPAFPQSSLTKSEQFCQKPKQLKSWTWQLISKRSKIPINFDRCFELVTIYNNQQLVKRLNKYQKSYVK